MVSEHTVKSYDDELKNLSQIIAQMGGLAEAQLQSAIEAPRVASYSFPSSFAPFEYFPGRLAVEGRIDQATRDALAARGHTIQDWPEWTWLAGSVEAILTDPDSGLIGGGADPRRPAYAIAI